jgi:hypothetical protein
MPCTGCGRERYQMHCQYCHRRFEAFSIAQVLEMVEAHEAKRKDGVCPDNKDP